MNDTNILTNCALRFDGYAYLDTHPFDHNDALDQYKSTGSWDHLNDYQKLATLFLLQRYLCKWGGEMLSLRSITWRGYRQLFLETCLLPTPKDFRDASGLSDWDTLTKPQQEAGIATVRAAHKATDYADSDLLSEYYPRPPAHNGEPTG